MKQNQYQFLCWWSNFFCYIRMTINLGASFASHKKSQNIGVLFLNKLGCECLLIWYENFETESSELFLSSHVRWSRGPRKFVSNAFWVVSGHGQILANLKLPKPIKVKIVQLSSVIFYWVWFIKSSETNDLHCLWKEILSQPRIRHFKISQSIYFA